MKEKYLKYASKHYPRLDGKICLVTGSTGGLGESICEYLLYLGATLLLPVRNPKKLESLKSKLLEEYPDAKIFSEKLDFGDLNSIDEFEKTLTNYGPIDYLFNNIGTLGVVNENDVVETTIKTNAVATVYFTEKIIPHIVKEGRIITTTSSSMYFFKRHNFKDYDYTKGNYMRKYSTSKKVLTHSMLVLKEKYPEYNFVLAHPGATATSLFYKSKNKLIRVCYPILKLLFHSKENAALSLVSGIYMDTDFKHWIGPKGLFKLCGKPKLDKLPRKILHEEDKLDSYNEVLKMIEICKKDMPR